MLPQDFVFGSPNVDIASPSLFIPASGDVIRDFQISVLLEGGRPLHDVVLPRVWREAERVHAVRLAIRGSGPGTGGVITHNSLKQKGHQKEDEDGNQHQQVGVELYLLTSMRALRLLRSRPMTTKSKEKFLENIVRVRTTVMGILSRASATAPAAAFLSQDPFFPPTFVRTALLIIGECRMGLAKQLEGFFGLRMLVFVRVAAER
jgi:hypothetical protein